MLAFILGLIILVSYLIIKSSTSEQKLLDVTGLVGILFIIWGISRYQGVSPKPLWDPN